MAATFPLPFRIGLGEAMHEAEIVRERDGGYVADRMAARSGSRSRGLGRDAIRFRKDGVTEQAKFLRDGDRLYILHHGTTLRSGI